MILAAKFAAIGIACIYLAIATFLYLNQRRILYQPSTARTAPAAVGLKSVEEQMLTTRDGEKIISWHVRPKPGMPMILFFHGNGGAIGDRAERLAVYMQNGFGALFVSYRGYGGSTGQPTEAGLEMDALAAYDWLIAQDYRPEQIVLVGESLGSGVAVGLASMCKVSAMALEAPYSAIADVAAYHYWYLPVRLLLKDRFDSAERIGKIGVPVLISHGDRDMVVPIVFGRRLFDAALEPKAFFELDGEGHEAIFEPRVWQREMEFFKRYAVGQ